MKMRAVKPTRRRLITAALLLGGVALTACGTAGPGVQARQTGDTTTTAEPTTTTASTPTTAAPATTAPPTTAAPAAPSCSPDALTAAYNAKFGGLSGANLAVQKCVDG